ncbi:MULTISPECIES: hypothetical protein [Clostridium]|uniref:Uncharacterized protein n=1 Tax=Clostridium paridis TaxID=2803863 RepID=A0A937K423_9CLOT|nr:MULTISPECIES: hypothetical protein [Clostridium]MBL4931409.1 hypothetical protein [Clostridium paridis]MDD7795127.1 hypothetical protein [Clostridium sp. 'White wine YQ']
MEKRKRGILITIILVIQGIFSFLGLSTYFNEQRMQQILKDQPTFAQFYTPLTPMQIVISTILSLITLVAIIGIFMWKKKAIYVYLAAGVINGIYGAIADFTAIAIIGYIIQIGICVLISKTLLKKLETNIE